MFRIFCLAAALAATFLLAGCGAGEDPRGAIYSSPVRGQFNNTGEFTANFVFAVGNEGKTFNGSLQDFRFSRKSFDSPEGAVPVTGTISRNEKGEILLKGKGQGTLTQGRYAYQLEFQMESSYVDPRFNTVNAWFFGGGNMNRSGAYVEWAKISGNFSAKPLCRPERFKSCEILTAHPAPAMMPQN